MPDIPIEAKTDRELLILVVTTVNTMNVNLTENTKTVGEIVPVVAQHTTDISWLKDRRWYQWGGGRVKVVGLSGFVALATGVIFQLGKLTKWW